MSSKAEVTERIVELVQLVIASSVMTNERIARSLGLNVVDMQAFGFIARHGAPMTAGEVSQQTELPTSTTTRVLDRLEKHGLIERSDRPDDRRRVVVRALPEAFPERDWAVPTTPTPTSSRACSACTRGSPSTSSRSSRATSMR